METHPVVFGSGETECSDLHIRMIHLRQANKRDHDLAAFRELQNENLFTDMTLVLKVINNLKQKKIVSIFNYLSIKSLQFCSLADFFII
jgi:hypothetical protein